MKSFTRTCLIFSGVLIAIGLVIIIITGALGAGSSFAAMMDNGRFSFGWNNDSYFINNEDLTSTKYEFHDIDDIYIDLKYGELNIETTNDNTYQVKVDNMLKGFTCEGDDGDLVIKDNFKHKWNVKLKNDYHPSITLYVPENAKLEQVEIDMGAGYAGVTKLNADIFKIGLGAGEFEGNEIVANETSLDVGAGHLSMKEFISDNIDMNCGTGRVELEGNINKDVDIKCGLGSILLSLNNVQSNFDYDINCGIGNVTIGSTSFGGVACKKYISNNADHTMGIKCGVGNVEIDFAESF